MPSDNPKPISSGKPEIAGNETTLASSDSGPSSGGAPTLPQFVIGSVLGERYEIIAKLGEGGMGAVYQARDRELSRDVALKVIRGDLASDPVILERFKHELVSARQITHRNVIRIYDLGESEGTRFITMEFVDGQDLGTILARESKLTPQGAVEIIKQVCNGLQAAHTEAVIHRDLKPSNIMRDVSGRVVIMDFGLAKTERDEGLTRTGLMIGTSSTCHRNKRLARLSTRVLTCSRSD